MSGEMNPCCLQSPSRKRFRTLILGGRFLSFALRRGAHGRPTGRNSGVLRPPPNGRLAAISNSSIPVSTGSIL